MLHAELRLGQVVVMVASFDEDYDIPALKGRSVGYGLYICADDVDGPYEKAVATGATGVLAPESTEWGTRRARVRDPGGNEWSFGSYFMSRRVSRRVRGRGGTRSGSSS